ncbi:MAG TPA: Crp/Fnr family transcriptional regulator [Burkholderiales bacterium]|nr:Crp/Fnr family transcriptional regulator [Burkholderiales bacterium]
MLEDVPLFRGLSTAALAKIERRTAARSYARHAVVITEGDDAISMFVIESGSVKVYRTESDGREIVLNILSVGQHFGELALVDETARSASVMTLEPSRLLVLPKAAFREFLAESPEIAYQLITQLVQEVRRLTQAVSTMGRDVYGRLKALLESMAVTRNGVLIIDQPMTQQDIANRIASSREMVSRILKELKSGGYIDEQDKRLLIKKKLPAHW